MDVLVGQGGGGGGGIRKAVSVTLTEIGIERVHFLSDGCGGGELRGIGFRDFSELQGGVGKSDRAACGPDADNPGVSRRDR